jgi:Xaa-Pro aminopeptidase
MKSRLAALSAGLEELGCEALLILASSAEDSDLASFLPGAAHLGECLLVLPRLPREAGPRLGFLTPMEREEAAATGLALLTPEDLDVSRWASELPDPAYFLSQVVGRALERCGVAPGRVALAGHGQAGTIQAACAALSREGWAWVPGNALMTTARKPKEPAELAGLRDASAAACKAFHAVARLLAAATVISGELWLEGEPLRVARLRAEIARVLAGDGFEQPRGNILGPAEEGAIPHCSGTPDRVLRAGESLVVDVFPKGRLFSDCTRTFCVGEPSEALRRGHARVREALEEASLRARPGVRGWEVQEAVCARFEAAGYPTPLSEPGTTRGYVHNLGHGVGFDLHELPTFKKASGAEGVLRAGDVFTLEPGLYDPEARWAVRLEDLHHLTEDGLEVLTPLPYDLDPRAWEQG